MSAAQHGFQQDQAPTMGNHAARTANVGAL